MPLLNAYVVEDSPVIRENLIAALEEMAPLHVCGTAADEATAVDWLCDPSHAWDLAVIDIFLRKGSGIGVLRALGKSRPNCKRVVLTNYASADVRRRCMALGAARVFDKSGDIESLIDYCSSLAATRAADAN